MPIEEVQDVIRKLKNNKAAEEDGLSAEIFKHSSKVLVPWLLQIITRVWDFETLSQDWGDAVLLSFFKKGRKTLL